MNTLYFLLFKYDIVPLFCLLCFYLHNLSFCSDLWQILAPSDHTRGLVKKNSFPLRQLLISCQQITIGLSRGASRLGRPTADLLDRKNFLTNDWKNSAERIVDWDSINHRYLHFLTAFWNLTGILNEVKIALKSQLPFHLHFMKNGAEKKWTTPCRKINHSIMFFRIIVWINLLVVRKGRGSF